MRPCHGTHPRLPKRFRPESSDPILDCLPLSDVADSLCRSASAADMLAMTESETEDSESETESVPLRDS